MTARAGTMSVDGSPISRTDLARIQAEEELHAHHQRSAVKVVAASSNSTEDCRMLLSILGLDGDVVASARGEFAQASGSESARPRKPRAA